MKTIEFIGASGSGKSTLFAILLEQRGERRWLTATEAKIKVAKQLNFQRGIYAWFVFLLKRNALRRYQSVVADILLRAYLKKDMHPYLSRYNPIITICLANLVHEQNIEAYRKGLFFEFYMNLLKTEVLLPEKLAVDDLVVFEDGLWHNSDGVGNPELAFHWHGIDQAELSALLPTGVIYCDLPAGDLFQRKLHRVRAGRGTMFEKGAKEEIQQMVEESIRMSSQTVEFLSNHGVPILTIRLDEDQEKNIQAIQEFIFCF